MAPPHRLVALAVTLSLLFIGTSISQTTQGPLTGNQLDVDWEDDQLREEFEALCFTDHWIQAGQLAPGVNISKVLDTARSAWHTGSLLEVASLLCIDYGPTLNLLSGGIVQTVCEPVIDAALQGKKVDVEGLCYQLWQMFQNGHGISFEPPCQKESTDDHFFHPDGTQSPWFHHDGYIHDLVNSLLWFDFGDFNQVLKDTFSFLSEDSSDFCYKFGSVMFNDSISAFDVVDHALHTIFRSLSHMVYEKCSNADHHSTTSQVPDGTILILSYLTETGGREGLCTLLQSSMHSEENVTYIAEKAKNTMFEVLQNHEMCLGLYNVLSPYNDIISQTTGFYLGERFCDYIVSSFDAENEHPSGTDVPLGILYNLTKEFPDGSFNEMYFPFQEAITILAQVLNSNTAADGMKVLCSVISPILDMGQVEMCSALNEKDYEWFVDSCLNSCTFPDQVFPTNDYMYDHPNIPRSHFINGFFKHLYHMQEMASKFNHEINPHIDLREFLQSVFSSVPVTDSEDTCTIVGNILYDSDFVMKDIILHLIDKELVLLYHMAPHLCQIPLDPDHQWQGGNYPPEDEWTGNYGETYTYDTPVTHDGKKDRNLFYDTNEEVTTEGWYEGWQEYTTDGKKQDDHYPPKDDGYGGMFDGWWDVHIGPLRGKIIEKLLTFLSGYSDENAFCHDLMQANETIYRMQAIENVQQMKDKLISVVEEYDICLTLVYFLKEDLTDSEFHQHSGYDSAENVCDDIIDAFKSLKRDPISVTGFCWPNFYDNQYIFSNDYNTMEQLENGELAPGVSLSSFINFAGQLYNAPIMDGARLVCHAFSGFMGHFETESCGFLESSRPKYEFIEYCQGYGSHDDDYYHYEDHHEGSFFDSLQWEHLPSSISEVFGIPFRSEPMCHEGWDLFTSQTVKSTIQGVFQVVTRFLIAATSDEECGSDHEYVTMLNDTHFAVDYLYNYNEGKYDEMNFDFLGLLYSYLGGCDDILILCTEVKSALQDPEAITTIVEEMTSRLFQIFENNAACVSFVDTISEALDHNSTGLTVGKLVGMKNNGEFCGNLTDYITGKTDVSFNATSLLEILTNLTELSGDEEVITSQATDYFLQFVSSIYRSNSIREASYVICPVIEMIPDLDPEIQLELLDACFQIQKINSTSFNELCTSNLQYYIPYFWIWVNHDSHSGDDDEDNDENDRQHHDYWDYGHYDDDDFLSHMSMYSMRRLLGYVFEIPFFDSSVVCYGIDSWLQTTSGADIVGTVFRLFQVLLISQSANMCPTQYYYMSEPPPEQPDLDFSDTDFSSVIGAMNTFLGNYTDYEYLCWDAQTAYLEWDYDGDSTRMDMMLDHLTEKFMEVLHDEDQCLGLMSAMNRMPIVGPVAAQIGFESNEMFCEFVVSRFESAQGFQIDYQLLQLLFIDEQKDGARNSEEEWVRDMKEVTTRKWEHDWTDAEKWEEENNENEEDDTGKLWIKHLRLGVQEMINILSIVYAQDAAITALNDICVAVHHIASNNSFAMSISFTCEQIATEGSVLSACMDNVRDLFDDSYTYYDEFPWATQESPTDNMPAWIYLEGVLSKLLQIVEHVYGSYSGFGLNYDRLEQIALIIQREFKIDSFNLKEPFSGCSFVRRVLTTDQHTLIGNLTAGLAYPIGDFLEYIGQFGLCNIVGNTTAGEESTDEETEDFVAYRLLKNLLQQFLGMDDAQFCEFTEGDHTLEEYRTKGLLIAQNMVAIFSNETTCTGVVNVIAGEDRYNMLFNLTGADLSAQGDRLTFCQHLVASFSGETQFIPTEYTLPRGEILDMWEPFSSPGQLLPQLDFSDLVSILGAVYSSPTLLEGSGVLCNAFGNILAEDSVNLSLNVTALCDAVEAMDAGLVELQCLNFTVPWYYGKYYPITLRPIDGDRIGMSIVFQLLNITQLTRDSVVCPALDSFFNSNRNLQDVVHIILNTWLKELVLTAAGICQSWEEVMWYFSPMRYFNLNNPEYSNWTTMAGDDIKQDQELYENAINTTTNLTSSILGLPDRESLCGFIQSGINSTTGNVMKGILDTIIQRLSAVFIDAGNCTLVIESVLELLMTDLHVLPTTFYNITGYPSPKEFCQTATELFNEEACFEDEDCFGVCGGLARPDCSGVCNGTATVDCKGVCEGKTLLDCNDVCGGEAIISDCSFECVGGDTEKPLTSGYDECGLCTHSEDYNDVRDCAGTCFGTASIDTCEECTGGETGLTFDEGRLDCNGECDGTAFEDCLGNCIIAGETGAEEDACGICNGSNTACVFALGLSGMQAGVQTNLTVTGAGFSAELENICVFAPSDGEAVEITMEVSDSQSGICYVSLPEGVYTVSVKVGATPAGGEAQTLEVWSSCSEEIDCTGVCGGSTVEDCNGVCGGTAEEDCSGECGGSLVVDCTRVCGGDTKEDCLGICDGDTPVDCSGTCNGTAVEDCSGVCQGTAYTNDCGYCVGGTTGRSDSLGYDQCGVCKTASGYVDSRDCFGTCNGEAFVDNCGVCVGGETGKPSTYSDSRLDCRDVCDGTWQPDACNICEPDGSETTSIYMDCNGDCHPPGSVDSSAYTNDCDQCVGGNTDKSDDYGQDACGVCGGSNETCTGCDGVLFSNAEVDACGVCGGTGSSCIVVSSLDQNIVLTNEATELTITGAGFTSDKTYTCSFSGSETVTSTMVPSSLTSGTCTATLPLTGTYTLTIFGDDDAISVADDATLNVYAIDAITLASISPSKPLTSDESTTFTITANADAFTIPKSLDVPLYVNVYSSESSSYLTQLTASFDEGSSNAITFSHSASTSIQVILKPDIDGFGELPGDGLELTVYSPSPQLTALYFDSLGRSIIAEFDSPVNALVLSSCSDILADTTTLGTDAFCYWTTAYRLTIVLGSGDSLVTVGDTLTFIRNNIVALFQEYPYPEDADSVFEMTVASPETTPSVRVLLLGSSVVSNCGRIKGVLYSQGAAGRELTNEWTVTSTGDTSLVAAALAEFSGKSLDLDVTLLEAGVNYTISVTASNFLGGSGTTSMTVQRSTRETPDVVVSAIGIDKDNAYVSDSFVLVADIFYSECAPAGETVFSWSVDSDEVALSFKRSTRSLFVGANSLPAGTKVTFAVRIYKSSEPDNYVEEFFTITTQYSDLEAVISQGKFITVGHDNGNVELDGTLSSDPNNVAQVMTYEWQCEQITDNTGCWSYKSGHTGETILQNAESADSILTFDAAHMDSNKIYMFTLIVRKGLRSASTFIYVTPVAGTPPVISISPITDARLHDEILDIQTIISHSSEISQAVWSTTDTNSGNGYLDMTDTSNFITSPILRSIDSETSFSLLALQRNVLAPGATYSFKLTVTTVDNQTSEATVEVRVRNIVSSCVVSLDDGSSSYTELESIVIAVDSCTTDEDAYPLTFQLFEQNSDGNYEAKTGSEPSDRISISGPPARLTNNDIPYNVFRVEVCNNFAVCAKFEAAFNVDAVVLDQTGVTTVVETLIEIEESRQNYGKAMVNLNMLVIRLGVTSVSSSLPTSSRRRRAADQTSVVNQKRQELAQNHMDNNDLDTKTAEVLISELSDYDVYNSTQDDMETLVDQYSDLVDVFMQDDKSLPEDSSVKMLEKLREIKNQVPSTAGRIREKMNNLTSNLEKTHFSGLQLGGEERKTETSDSTLVFKKDIPKERMTFDSSFSVKLGSDLRSRYSANWNCSSGSCNGVTFRFKKFNDSVDEYSVTAEDIANRAAEILEFSLYDPDSGEELTISDLSDGVTFNMTITRPQSGKDYQCRFFNSTTSEWSSDGLTSEMIDTSVVTCQTFHLSVFTVVVVDPVTTVVSTTQEEMSSQDSASSETDSVATDEARTVAFNDVHSDETTHTESFTADGEPTVDTNDVHTDETTSTESFRAESGDDSTGDSSTESNPVPSGGGNGAVIGIIVAVVVLVVIIGAVIGVTVVMKMKAGTNKVTSESNFEAAHPASTAPSPPHPVAAAPPPAQPAVFASTTPSAFESAAPVAVPLKEEPNMPPPPSVFVPPGDEATVVMETEPPPHPHSPEPTVDPEMESSKDLSEDGEPSPAANADEDIEGSSNNLPEPSE